VEIRRSKAAPILGRDTGSGIRVPQEGTSQGAGFGDSITNKDRLYAMQREPVAKRITKGIAKDVFDNWFKVDDPKTEGGDEDLDERVQKILLKLGAKQILIQALAYDRGLGYSLIVGAFDDAGTIEDLAKPRREGAKLVDVAVYRKDKVTSTEKETNQQSERFGEVNYYLVDRGSSKRLRIHYSRVIAMQTDPDGESVLDNIWDDLTNLRNIRWGMGQTMYRYGGGFPVVTINGADRTELEDWEASGYFDDLMSRTYILKSDTMDFEFRGAEGAALNPVPYYNPILENISAGTGIPLAVLRGAQAGALTGSEVNEREYFKVISSIQAEVEPFVRMLIDWIKTEAEIEGEYKVNWMGGFEPSEKDKAAADLMHEQANEVRLKYRTVNEVRELEDLDAIEGGDELMKPEPPQPPPQQGEERPEEQEAPATGDAVTHPTMYSALRGLAEAVHLSGHNSADCPVCQELRARGVEPKTLANASLEGERIIRLYVDGEVERAKAYLAAKAGRPLAMLPPEAQRVYDDMLEGYLSDLRRMLDAANRATE